MVVPFQAFIAVFAAILLAGCLLVLTPQGERLLVRVLRWVGTHSGSGPWAFRADAVPDPAVERLSVSQRLLLTEKYIAAANQHSIRSAHIVLWVFIGGCATAAAVGLLITSILPPFVVSGAWTYETYRRIAVVLVDLAVAGGVVAAVGIVVWLFRDAIAVTSIPEAAAARAVIAHVRRNGVDAELAHELSSGPFPLVRQLLHELG